MKNNIIFCIIPCSFLLRITGTLHEEQYKFLYHTSPIFLRITRTLHEEQYKFLYRNSLIFLRITGTLHEEQYKFLYHTSLIFLRITGTLENRTVFERMWKNFVERGRPRLSIWRMRVAYWIPEATNTHTKIV